MLVLLVRRSYVADVPLEPVPSDLGMAPIEERSFVHGTRERGFERDAARTQDPECLDQHERPLGLRQVRQEQHAHAPAAVTTIGLASHADAVGHHQHALARHEWVELRGQSIRESDHPRVAKHPAVQRGAQASTAAAIGADVRKLPVQVIHARHARHLHDRDEHAIAIERAPPRRQREVDRLGAPGRERVHEACAQAYQSSELVERWTIEIRE